MAKGKHSVALFEVIHKDKRFARKAGAAESLKTPSWWFKRNGPQAAASSNPITKDAPPVAPNQPRVQHAPVERAVTSPRPVSRVTPSPQPDGPSLVEQAQAAWKEIADYLSPRLRNVPSSALGAAAALVVIGGVMIGRHVTSGPRMADGAIVSTDSIRLGPAHPDVLQLTGADPAPTLPQHTLVQPTQLPTDPSQAQPATSSSTPATRTINLNYVLVQSYADEKIATDACNFLNRNGVPCTIEKGVRGWRKDAFLVIGLEGFTRVSGPDYVAYRRRIETLSTQFAPPHSYKGFTPQAIKWDRAN